MTTDLPLRHLSIRVPWHDTGWTGTICADPINNASCLRLHSIHARRDDGVEVEFRSRRIGSESFTTRSALALPPVASCFRTAATGETYIWEHLGMLSNPQYAHAWERKQAWYAASGVEKGGGDVATLIVTTDDERGGIDSAEVQAIVQEIA